MYFSFKENYIIILSIVNEDIFEQLIILQPIYRIAKLVPINPFYLLKFFFGGEGSVLICPQNHKDVMVKLALLLSPLN